MATVGIHLIWTTYGTWLPGDDRGHWSPLFDFYGHVVEKGGKLNRSDLMTTEACRERMKESPKVLDAEERIIVAAKIGEVVREHGIEVYAAAIESTHVHLLVGPLAEHVGIAAGRFKGATSSAVLELPRNQGRERTWTAKYWKVFLFDDVALEQVKRYIEAHNLRRGDVAAPFDWIRI